MSNQGVFINGERPQSKKAVREACETDPASVSLEPISFFGGDHDGPVTEFVGKTSFVGPDPHTKRNFFGTLERSADGTIKVT